MSSCQITIHNDTIYCSGNWTLQQNLSSLMRQINRLTVPSSISRFETNFSQLDSAGAWIVCQLIKKLDKQNIKVDITGLKPEQKALLQLIQSNIKAVVYPIKMPIPLNKIAQFGKTVIEQLQEAYGLITFLGTITVHLIRAIRRMKVQWYSLLNVIHQAGYNALGIVGLLTLLIGVVLAYQMGQQLKIYGANTYIVQLLGVGVLQEFSPLITAIIVAGRTSSAFTAQIGIMQVNQEIDVLRTMGLSPIDRLVIPKLLGLMIVMPLLIVWADIFGLTGGMLVAKYMLSINFYNFIITFPTVVQVSTFVNGLVKAPVFATIIALVGCFQGFNVSATSDSVGLQTTKSVVQAIFLIIIADAIFSIILPWQNLG